MLYFSFPYKTLLRRIGLTERALAQKSGLSRGCVRAVAGGEETCTLNSVSQLARALDCEVVVLVSSGAGLSEYSVVAASMKMNQDGFESWKIHLMDFVDEYRRTLDPRLILLPPIHALDRRLKSLLASTVHYLCLESETPTPDWAEKTYYLQRPWFLAEMQSLKASALVESPLSFRRNNIFTQDNFLERA